MATSKRKSKAESSVSNIRVISTKTCSSLSGKSTITYMLGLDQNDDLHFRLHENSGGGFFNDEWYPALAFAEALRAAGGAESVTSRVFGPMFLGRSANSPAFFAAVFRAEGVLLPYKRTSRHHVVGNIEAFLRLGDQSGRKPQSTPRKKPTPKSKAPSRAKSPKPPAE